MNFEKDDKSTHISGASGIQTAVAAAGSQAKLARALGVSEVAVHKWIAQGWAPRGRTLQIEAMFGVPRSLTLDPKIMGLFQAS